MVNRPMLPPISLVDSSNCLHPIAMVRNRHTATAIIRTDQMDTLLDRMGR